MRRIEQNVNGYANPSDLRSLIGISLDWGLVILLIYFSEKTKGPYAYGFALVLISGRIMSFATKWSHQAVHRSLFRRKSWNDSLDCFYALPVFDKISISRQTHLAHHRNYLKDKELPSYGYEDWGITSERARSRPFMIWLWFIKPLTGYHTLRAMWNIIKGLYSSKSYRLSMGVFWIVVVSMLSYLGALHLLLFYWLAPLFLVCPVLVFWLDLAQHYNADSELGTRDLHGWFFALLFANSRKYHAVHHLYPSIPWFRLSHANRKLVALNRYDVAAGFLDLSRQILRQPHDPVVKGGHTT